MRSCRHDGRVHVRSGTISIRVAVLSTRGACGCCSCAADGRHAMSCLAPNMVSGNSYDRTVGGAAIMAVFQHRTWSTSSASSNNSWLKRQSIAARTTLERSRTRSASRTRSNSPPTPPLLRPASTELEVGRTCEEVVAGQGRRSISVGKTRTEWSSRTS